MHLVNKQFCVRSQEVFFRGPAFLKDLKLQGCFKTILLCSMLYFLPAVFLSLFFLSISVILKAKTKL